MSAEPRQITPTEIWSPWEGKVVNGAFPLRKFLGGSSRSGVFLTEQTAENRPNVAIKFVPADTVQAEAQLVHWGMTTTLSHPNLVRIFDVGRYRFESRDYLYVVTEYADQTLAQILPRRPLDIEEVRELLLPTLDTLLFLHRKGLIHGRLRPSNFLAVDDRLKLSSDTVRPINHVSGGSARTSAYDPPELVDRGMNAAGDIWGLGMTLLEALTQHTTAWPDETVSLPADLPAPFANTVLRCLSIAPAVRPTVLDLDAQYKPAPPAQAQATPAPKPSQPHTPPQTTPQTTPPPPPPAAAPAPTPPQPPPPKAKPKAKVKATPSATKQKPWMRTFAIAFVSTLAAWMGLHLLSRERAPSQPAAVPAPAPATPPTVAKPAQPEVSAPAPAPAKTTAKDVLQEVMPVVPADAQKKIRGRLHVTVRVLVGPDGKVVGTMMENPGSSKFFAQLAEQAAANWKFVAAANQKQRVWLVRFIFTRNGVTARTDAQ